MNINVEYKDRNGQVQNKTERISILAFVKHMALAGQGFIPSLRKFRRTIGMFLRFSDYLDYNAFNLSYFSTPPSSLSDPTEKAQFSNTVGRAIADYLAKKLSQAQITFNYEAMMRLQGIKIQGSRPDLIAYSHNQKFAIEAKGYSDSSISNRLMSRIKNQSSAGPISVDFSIASVAYNLYSSVRVKYHDPDNGEPYHDNLLHKLSIEYYSGVLEYLNEEIFSIKKELIGEEEYNILSMRESIFYKLNLLDTILLPFPICIYSPEFSILISENVKRYAKEGFDNSKMNPIDEDNIYIDTDGIGLRLNRSTQNK